MLQEQSCRRAAIANAQWQVPLVFEVQEGEESNAAPQCKVVVTLKSALLATGVPATPILVSTAGYKWHLFLRTGN